MIYQRLIRFRRSFASTQSAGEPQCSSRKRAHGGTEYFHSLLAATLVAPGHQRVLPLLPEFVAPQDGCNKQDCESRAARRWLAKHGADYAGLNPVYLGDDLFSRQPICTAVRDAGGHFLFVCKPASHPAIEEFLAGLKPPELIQTVKRGRQRMTHRYRWLCDVPLRGDADAITVNWFAPDILNAAGETTYRNSFITDLPVTSDTVAELAACGRARWKIENESFNTLKTKGYHLEHNFGHGKANLAAVLASLNLLALTIHQFSRHSQSFGSGRARSISLTAVRRPRVNQESLLLASFLG